MLGCNCNTVLPSFLIEKSRFLARVGLSPASCQRSALFTGQLPPGSFLLSFLKPTHQTLHPFPVTAHHAARVLEPVWRVLGSYSLDHSQDGTHADTRKIRKLHKERPGLQWCTLFFSYFNFFLSFSSLIIYQAMKLSKNMHLNTFTRATCRKIFTSCEKAGMG